MVDRKKRKNYTECSIISAVAAVKNGSSFRKAAEQFNVPVTTVRDRYHSKYTDGKHVPGPSSALGLEQEESLKNHLLHMAKIGYGLSKKEIAPLIKEGLDKAEREDPDNYNEANRCFKDNLPSITWVYRFLSRHPELSSRTPEKLGYQRTYITEGQIRKWFENLIAFLQEEHGINAATFFSQCNANRIYNLDESGFPLAGTNGRLKIITAKGAKNVFRIAPDSKEQVTVLGCVSASGDFENPFVIFPGVRPHFNLQDVDPRDYDLGTSPNGWISADCFFEWLANIFYPRVRSKVNFPIIIFMDGHSSHINLAVSSFCREKGIILYCFPPHASHILQPLDVSVYGPLKKLWNDALTDFSREYRGLAMSKTHFFKVFDRAWKLCVERKQTAVAGFRKCGLLPLNPDAVAYDRLITSGTSHPHSRPNAAVSTMERVGITRVFQIFEECLSDNWRQMFETRQVLLQLIHTIYLVCPSTVF